jgi:hypothetical protein
VHVVVVVIIPFDNTIVGLDVKPTPPFVIV